MSFGEKKRPIDLIASERMKQFRNAKENNMKTLLCAWLLAMKLPKTNLERELAFRYLG